MDTININTDTKDEFEQLRLDLKIKDKKYRTQDELVKMLIDFFKINYKKEKKQ